MKSRFAVFMKNFLGSLSSCRDRPLQIANNVRVQLAYQITDVTRPQTHRVVCLWWATCRSSVEDRKLFVPSVNALFFLCFTQIEHDMPFSLSYCSQGYTFFHARRNFLTVLVEFEAVGSWSSGGWLDVELTPSASLSSSSLSSWFSGSTAIFFCLKNTLTFCCRFIMKRKHKNKVRKQRVNRSVKQCKQNVEVGSSLSRNCMERLTFLRQYDSTIISFCVRIEYSGIDDAKRRPKLNTAHIATVFSRFSFLLGCH